jgi:hypothetical protein
VTSAAEAVAASASVPAMASDQVTGFSGNPAIHARQVTMGICRRSRTPA